MRMTRCIIFTPVLPSRTRPESDAPRGKSAVKRLVIHPTDHEDFPRVELLDDSGDETGRVALEASGDQWIKSHSTNRAKDGSPGQNAFTQRARPSNQG